MSGGLRGTVAEHGSSKTDSSYRLLAESWSAQVDAERMFSLFRYVPNLCCVTRVPKTWSHLLCHWRDAKCKVWQIQMHSVALDFVFFRDKNRVREMTRELMVMVSAVAAFECRNCCLQLCLFVFQESEKRKKFRRPPLKLFDPEAIKWVGTCSWLILLTSHSAL